MKEIYKRQLRFDFWSISSRKIPWKLLEMNFWTNPQAEISFHTLIEVKEISPSQTLLQNTGKVYFSPLSVEIAYSQVASINRFISSLLRQDCLWNHLEFNLIKNSIMHTQR